MVGDLTKQEGTPMRTVQAFLQTAVIVSSLLPLRPALAQEQAAAPVFQEGDTWQFKVTDKGLAGGMGPSFVSTGTYEIAYTNGDFQVHVFGEERKQPVT